MADLSSILARLADKVDDEGGRLSIMADPKGQEHTLHGKVDDRWTVGIEFGEEEPGSAMYAGSAYGTGATLEAALAAVVQDLGL